MSSFTVNVPATSANLGPGFDVLGMALELYNVFHVQVTGGEGLSIRVEGEGAGELPRNEENLIYRMIQKGCLRAGLPVPGLCIRMQNAIPLNRGLGSSATAVLGGLLAAREIARGLGGPDAAARLDDDWLISSAVEAEGHPDNLMAALMGGITISYRDGGCYRGVSFMPPDPLGVVLLIPEIQVSTRMAREIMPVSHTTADAVENLRSISLFVYAMQRGEYHLLGRAMEDRIHQPYRAKLVPGFYDAVRGALDAGALGCALSGSGSTVIALCRGREREAAEQMEAAFRAFSVECRSLVTGISPRGAWVSEG
jgi:homoserine kinase